MDPQSPPKRMTRARAAKVESGLKTTKIVTAAAKAKATRGTAASSSTATKRKTRSDDGEDDDQDDDELSHPQPVAKATRTRTRQKKVAEPESEPEPAPTRTRTRVKKVVEEPPKQEPTRATRATRARRAQLEENAPAEVEKKTTTTTRARATSTTTKQPARTTVKKTVKFEEPEKENVIPAAPTASKSKTSESASGMRAKPVRRPAAAGRATRATKSALQTEKYEKPAPLSPKKVTQLAMNNRAAVDSEDELAADEMTITKPRVRGGAKLPVRAAKTELPRTTKPEEETTTTQPNPTVMLGSPCKRPPPSPWKDAMKSPAKKGDGVLSLPQPGVSKGGAQGGGQPSLKASLLQSPAKRPQSPIKGFEPAATRQESISSPFKGSLMSPAKRPFSPIKGFALPKKQEEDLGRTPAPKPTLLATPLPQEYAKGADTETGGQLDLRPASVRNKSPVKRFPGRLSAVLPRHADPTFGSEAMALQETTEEDETDVAKMNENENGVTDEGDPMHLDEEPEAELRQAERETTTPPASPPKYAAGGIFDLRDKELQPYNDVDSESEMEPDSKHDDIVPATPCPASSRISRNIGSSKSTSRSTRQSSVKRPRTGDKRGFTPLIHQLNGWKAGPSPARAIATDSPDVLSMDTDLSIPTQEQKSPTPTYSPVQNAFFEEAISADVGSAQSDVEGTVETGAEEAFAPGVLEPDFNDAPPVSEEDLALIKEANEMSLRGPDPADDSMDHTDPDETLSDASQEYGDENEIPVDPALLPPTAQRDNVPSVTPQRVLVRDFHTVSKVPLKPADDSTPRPKIKKRSHSISRLPVHRPTNGLTRSATVISYSPTKKREGSVEEQHDETERAQSVPPVTPTKSEAGWSMAGTPARTPRRDLDPALLRGAVVYVDVHTSEGSDASGIFVELLTQMGARCVKSWPWNPSSPPGPDGALAASRIGITHVVYKDGGKRTLEKVRESGGVVQCVGVSWVLE